MGLEPPQGLVDLGRRRLAVAAVDLGHEKGLGPVAVAQRLSHPDLAPAAVVVPTIVEEGDAALDGPADDADALGRILLVADVIPADPDARDVGAGAAELAVRHVGGGALAGCRGHSRSDDQGERGIDDFPAGHGGVLLQIRCRAGDDDLSFDSRHDSLLSTVVSGRMPRRRNEKKTKLKAVTTRTGRRTTDRTHVPS